MDVSPEDAKESLDQIRKTTEQTRKMADYAGTDVVLIAWGVIWVLGSMGNQFLLEVCHWIWLGLLSAGGIFTWLVMKFRSPVKSPVDKRVWLFMLFLFLYVGLWLGLLFPFVKTRTFEEGMRFSKHFGARMGTAAMFMYVVMGLWLEDFMLWLGLGVTALILMGLFLLQPYFWFWMAGAGGGTLIGTGLFIRKRWR